MNISKISRTIFILILFGIWLMFSQQTMALPSGISGYSGASGSTCTACHGGTATTPTVTLTADSGTVMVSPGSTTSYTLTMTGGPAVVAGLDVAATAGTIIDTNASGTRILNGELTMNSPNSVSSGTKTWTFNYMASTSPGTYTIYAAVLSGNGNGGTSGDGTGTANLQITVAPPSNQPPTAMISGPTTGLEGVAVTFDGSGSSDPDGTIVSYDWDLGDGSMATGVSATHTYAATGSYDVTLTVTDNSGNTDSATLTINIAASNVPPVAVISGPSNGTEGIAVSFNGSGSSDADGTIVSYDWNFGDGSAGSGETVSHTYVAGTYTVTLTVTDDMGATGEATMNISITAPTEPQPPIADAGGPYMANVGASVQFDGSGSMDPDGTITSYSWDFDDGSAPGTGVGPVHVYTASGTYIVVLTVTDDQGLTGTSQTTVEISDTTVPPVETCPPIDNNSQGEQLYNTYCESCHGAGGKGGPAGDVTGESANDIAEAIKEESQMGFLADILSDNDIQSIAAYLNNNSTHNANDGDYHYDGMRGDHNEDSDGKGDNDDDHYGNREEDDDDANKQCDSSKNNGNKGKGGGSSSRNANPFAAGADSSLQNPGMGGGALNWLVLIFTGLFLAIRKRRND